MIANIVLGMLLAWFTCVLVITVRAGTDRREQDARASGRESQRRAVMDESGVSLLASTEPGMAQSETPEAVTASLTVH